MVKEKGEKWGFKGGKSGRGRAFVENVRNALSLPGAAPSGGGEKDNGGHDDGGATEEKGGTAEGGS